MLYSCIHMATVGLKGLTTLSSLSFVLSSSAVLFITSCHMFESFYKAVFNVYLANVKASDNNNDMTK